MIGGHYRNAGDRSGDAGVGVAVGQVGVDQLRVKPAREASQPQWKLQIEGSVARQVVWSNGSLDERIEQPPAFHEYYLDRPTGLQQTGRQLEYYGFRTAGLAALAKE